MLNSFYDAHQVTNAVEKTAGFGTKANYIKEACFVGCKFTLSLSLFPELFNQYKTFKRLDVTVSN
jgi:hypothetical protein